MFKIKFCICEASVKDAETNKSCKTALIVIRQLISQFDLVHIVLVQQWCNKMLN